MPSSWHKLDRYIYAWMESWIEDVQNGITSRSMAEKVVLEKIRSLGMGTKFLAVRETLLKRVQFFAH